MPMDKDSLELFGPTHRFFDPDTSVAAGQPTLLRRHDRVLALLAHKRSPSGLTDFELGDRIARQQTSAGKRRGELRDAGLIADSKTRRPAPSGSSAIVWCITTLGEKAAEDIIKCSIKNNT